jgi:hypothetical protein
MFNNEYRLHTKESPRQIILEDYKLDLPIKGGWGYGLEDACVIDKYDQSANLARPFNGVNIEYIFAEKRLYEEMIVFRAGDERFGGIRWNCDLQELIHHNDKPYDHLIFDITAYQESVWDEISARFDLLQKDYLQEKFDELEAYRVLNIQKFRREYFFDISSFFDDRHKDDWDDIGSATIHYGKYKPHAT